MRAQNASRLHVGLRLLLSQHIAHGEAIVLHLPPGGSPSQAAPIQCHLNVLCDVVRVTCLRICCRFSSVNVCAWRSDRSPIHSSHRHRSCWPHPQHSTSLPLPPPQWVFVCLDVVSLPPPQGVFVCMDIVSQPPPRGVLVHGCHLVASPPAGFCFSYSPSISSLSFLVYFGFLSSNSCTAGRCSHQRVNHVELSNTLNFSTLSPKPLP
mmetsp:Transcript_47314/g.110273  ORF Transcript_47314/g.110273 Transcript_47314/m.110273 type:complete len:208 (-) Transcript_47314:226-849(-)